MSRVRSTLDTVSKAVSGTHSELLSKITRLKPTVLKTGKKAEATVESTAEVEETAITSAPPPNNVIPSSAATKTTFDSTLPTSTQTSAASTFDASASVSSHPPNSSPPAVGATASTTRDPKDKNLRRIVLPVNAGSVRKSVELKLPANDAESKNAAKKQTTALFHPSTFSVSLDETYNYLAHHINSYFGVSNKDQAKKVDRVDNSASSQGAQASSTVPVSDNADPAAAVESVSSKKGLGHYLSYSAPTVQAFVGSYIAPLVPKFRTSESKSAAVAENKLQDAPAKQVEATITTEQKVAEEKAKKLLLQREKVSLQKVMLLFACSFKVWLLVAVFLDSYRNK